MYAASSGFGFSRGRYGVAGGIPMQMASNGPSTRADRDCTPRTSASA
jgi:hypothetical protein